MVNYAGVFTTGNSAPDNIFENGLRFLLQVYKAST